MSDLPDTYYGQQLMPVAEPSYAPLFDQSVGEIDFKEFLAKNDTVIVNLPRGSISDGLTLMLVKLLLTDVHQMHEKQA